jgi:hypothetical protein
VDMKHVQCLLQKGKTRQTAWIPESFAKQCKIVKLYDEDGWRVVETYAAKDSKFVLEHEHPATDRPTCCGCL